MVVAGANTAPVHAVYRPSCAERLTRYHELWRRASLTGPLPHNRYLLGSKPFAFITCAAVGEIKNPNSDLAASGCLEAALTPAV